MGDFKINRLNPIAWVGAIYYKVNNWWQRRQYEKQGDKILKRINNELAKKSNTKQKQPETAGGQNGSKVSIFNI